MEEGKKVEDVVVKFLGDSSVGKTSTLLTYRDNSFPLDYCPSCFDDYVTTVVFDKKHIKVGLRDTHIGYGMKMHEEERAWKRIRATGYRDVNVFIILFSLVDVKSFENVEKKWIPEVLEHGPKDAKFIIVGNKQDLINDREVLQELKERDEVPIETKQIENLAKRYESGFVECSAKTKKNLKLVFKTAYLTHFDITQEGSSDCSLL